jgi:hypothetical protein
MSRTSFGFKAASGLVIAATLLALEGLSSRANAAEPQASNLAMALTCPEQQGQLKRLSASSDGASCTYGIDSDKTFQASLLRINVVKTNSLGFWWLFLLLSNHKNSNNDFIMIEKNILKDGIELGELDLERDSDSKIYNFMSIERLKSEKSDISSASAVMRGYKSGPVAIGIYRSKEQMNVTVNEDFAALMEGATASWINPAQPAPPH